MKIAVLGAPGSGKSDFAHELAELLQDPEESGMSYLVLDGLVEDLRLTTGQEYGMLGNHIDDLQVVFKRLEWESAWSVRSSITVGTVLDSSAHNFARVEHVSDSEVPLTQIKLQAIAATFGMLYTDTWDYDYAFLLGKPEDFTQGGYPHLIQVTLNRLINAYRAPVLTFNPEVPNDKKASTAADAIRALEEETAIAASIKRGVRRGGEDREDDGDSPEPVPDVPEQGTDGS